MFNKLKKVLFHSLLGLSVVAVAFSCKNKADGESQEAAAPAIDRANMDLQVNPGDDFFKYANGAWMAANEIPADKSRFGAFDELQESTDSQLNDLIAEISKDSSAAEGSVKQKIRDMYISGMDTVAIEAAGITPIAEELKKIDAIATKEDLLKEMMNLQSIGISPLFYLYADQDKKNSQSVIAGMWQAGIGLPDRDYYFEEGEYFANMRTEYLTHLKNMFVLLGEDEATAKASADVVFGIEKRIAQNSNTNMENRDEVALYNLITLDELQKTAPNINWKEFFAAIGAQTVTQINVSQPKHLKEVNAMLKEVSINDWKTFLRWNLLSNMASYLNSAVVKEDFHFYSTVLSGVTEMKPRWKNVLAVTSGSMGEAMGQLYVEKYFPAQAKERMLKLVENLKVSMGERIQDLQWMEEATKTKALEKLNAINVKVGYPDKWRDYSGLNIVPNSYVENVIAARRFNVLFEMNKIGKPLDPLEWGMSPQTVNAYYSPNRNEIVFPAAILQPPFFFMEADDAVNYGAIGVVIGHEMTHGFDDQGRLYDKNGNMIVWWSEKDSTEFANRTQLLVEQYNGFKVQLQGAEYGVDGDLTLGENIADLGGLLISYQAFMKTEQAKSTDKIDDFTAAQRFFLAYAQVWRQNIREQELIRRLKEDVHSPGEFRVNGALFNVPQFYEAFNIQAGSKLYRTPEQIPVIW